MVHHDPTPFTPQAYELNFPEPERHPSNHQPIFENLDDVRTITPLDNTNYLERPTDQIIESLHEDDPRIDAVHFSNEQELQHALADKLRQDFEGEDVIAIRAVEASLDGLVEAPGLDIHDIRDILRMGDINNRDHVNLAGFSPNSDDKDSPLRIQHRVVQFATKTGFFRKFEAEDAPGAKKIFPVVLVYDANLKRARNSVYGFELPIDETERSQVIRKAYILDAEIRSNEA